MAPLYGTVRGRSRTKASRLGTDEITVTASTWDGGVRVHLERDGRCWIYLNGGSGYSGRDILLYSGNVNELQERARKEGIISAMVVFLGKGEEKEQTGVAAGDHMSSM